MNPRDPSDLHIVVVGAFAADCVINTPVLPGWGEDHEVRSMYTTPVGKALNQAVALARLGARVSAIGATGDDALGQETRSLLAEEGVDTSGIDVRRNTATPICLCFVGDDGRGAYVSHTAPEVAVTAETVRANESTIWGADAVLTTLEPLPEGVREAINLGRAANAYVVAQPAPMKHPRSEVTDLPWSQADLVVPNEAEARTLLTEPVPSEKPEDLVTALFKQLNGPQLVITLAERGCISLDYGTPSRYPAVEPSRVVDTTGASDAFTATLTLQRTGRVSEVDSVRRALHTAASSVNVAGGHRSMPIQG